MAIIEIIAAVILTGNDRLLSQKWKVVLRVIETGFARIMEDLSKQLNELGERL